MRSITMCTVLFALGVGAGGCRAADAAADGGPEGNRRDGGSSDGARMDGSFRFDGATRGDARAPDGAIRGGEMFMDATLDDGSLHGDGGERIDGSLGPDGSLGCTLSSCGPGYECCVDDGTCQPISCSTCCARRPDGSAREDASVPGREDVGLPSGSDAGSVRRVDGGGLILPIDDDGGFGPGISCGGVVCDFGTYCCPGVGVCVPTDCPECCGGGGPFPPPPEPPPPPPGF